MDEDACGVTVIVIDNRCSELSLNTEQGCLHFI